MNVGDNPLRYQIDNKGQPVYYGVYDRDPTTTDGVNFTLGFIWINKLTNESFILTSKPAGVNHWESLGDTGAVLSVTGGSNINITGTATNPIVNLNNSVSVSGSLTAGTTVTAGIDVFSLGGHVTSRRSLNDTTGASVILDKDRVGAIVQTGDTIGAVGFFGYDGANYINAAGIQSVVEGTPGLTAIGGNLIFTTNPGTAAASPLTRLTINKTGNITIANPSTGTALTIAGSGLTVSAGTTTLVSTYGNTVSTSPRFVQIDSAGVLGATAVSPSGIVTAAGDSGTATGATVTFAGAGGITTSASGSTVTFTGSGGGGGTIVTLFDVGTTSFTKNASTKQMQIIAWAAGSGGGSGSRAATDASSAGGGGAAGSFINYMMAGDFFPATAVNVVVGAGGSGGAAITSDDTDGNDGTTGGNTTIGTVLGAFNSVTGFGEGGVQSSSADGGDNGNSYIMGFGTDQTALDAGDGSTSNGGNAVAPVGSWSGPGGGGSGNDSGGPNQGGQGADILDFAGNILLAGGAGGIEGGTINGGNGLDAFTAVGGPDDTLGGQMNGGSGGGGGGGQLSGGSAGTGGNGGFPGGGGGGGGGSNNGTNSGAGGDGADGYCIIVEYT